MSTPDAGEQRGAPAPRPGGRRVVAGRAVRVVVPGSSANLGPGFDAVGLALGVQDTVLVEALDDGAGRSSAVDEAPGAEVAVTGEGAGRVGLGEDSLVVRSVRALLHAAGAGQPRLRLSCRNGVPHGRGVGSSAAAVVAGAVAASALLDAPLPAEAVLDAACDVEGHPDNAAASLLGGLTLGWRAAAPGAGAGGPWRAVRVEPHPALDVVLCVPEAELSTARARAMLPLHVPHADAAHAAGRAALLVEALTRSPDLLLDATADRLHQPHRAAAMPASMALLTDLRRSGHSAVVSGAGPSVLVVCPSAACADDAAGQVAATRGWTALRPGIAREGARAAVTRPGDDPAAPAPTGGPVLR